MQKSPLFFLIALLSGSCFLQAASTPATTSYLNSAPTASTPPAAPEVQPYELTLDALVNTPWGSVENVITPVGTENRHTLGASFFSEQQVPSVSITLGKSQDLVLHIPNAWKPLFIDQNRSAGALYLESSVVMDWDGWDNYIQGHLPLDMASLYTSTSGLEGKTIDYHFKNQHAGKISLQFIYCIFGDDNNGSSRFNVEDVIVTIKSGS